MTVFRCSMRLLGSCSQEFHSCSRAVSMRPPIFCAGVSSVELGADCEVAVADVSFMAMAGAPGASRALSTTIGRLIEPFTRPLNEREKEIAPREATMSQLSRERERKRGAKRRAKSKITSVFLMVLIFLIFLIFLIVIVAASEVRCF